MTLPDKRSPGSHCGWFTSYLWSLIYILPNGLIKQVLFLPRYTWLGKVRTLLPKPKHYSCFISSILTAARFSIPVMEQGGKKAVGGSNPCGAEEREKSELPGEQEKMLQR